MWLARAYWRHETLAYNAENQLATVTQGTSTLASFSYDGDGKRVKKVEGYVTTYYVGDCFEWEVNNSPLPTRTP